MGFFGFALTVAVAVGTTEPPQEGTAARPAGRDPARASDYTAEQVKSTVEEHVARELRESGGEYRLQDELTGETVGLKFVDVSIVAASPLWRVHDPDRRIDRRAFFACVRFEPAGGPAEKLYDVDVLIEPADGGLAVTDVRIHKVKRLVKGKWVWEERKASPDRPVAKRP
jgi:hypothetical protein